MIDQVDALRKYLMHIGMGAVLGLRSQVILCVVAILTQVVGTKIRNICDIP